MHDWTLLLQPPPLSLWCVEWEGDSVVVTYAATVEGTVQGWDHWEKLFVGRNSSFTVPLPLPTVMSVSLVGSFDDVEEQGGSGFDT